MYQYIHLYIHSYIYLYIYTSIYRYIILRGNYFIPFNLCGKTSAWKILINRPGRIFHCFQILENFVRPEKCKKAQRNILPLRLALYHTCEKMSSQNTARSYCLCVICPSLHRPSIKHDHSNCTLQ